MQYDRLGFPIPKEFEPAAERARTTGNAGRLPPGFDVEPRDPSEPGPFRRFFLVGVLLLGVLPVLLLPKILPVVRREIVDGAIRQAMVDEGRADVAGAARQVGRALAWVDGDADQQHALLCWRSALRLQDGDARGAITDATAAAIVAPKSARPLRTRAIARVVAGDVDAALSRPKNLKALARAITASRNNLLASIHGAFLQTAQGQLSPAEYLEFQKTWTVNFVTGRIQLAEWMAGSPLTVHVYTCTCYPYDA